VEVSSFFFSGISNLMIFRSGSGFFSTCPTGFDGSFTSGTLLAVSDDVSLEGAGSSFPNLNFICTPPNFPNL
jgi:hypothetical protein